jgi:hypothetical protein
MWSFTNSCVDVMPSLDSWGAPLYIAWLSRGVLVLVANEGLSCDFITRATGCIPPL